ncbi:MAG: TlyA family RNA methyltransferase [Myxococcales bacterium]|nr:TlyA family RNA methyltransferase [Myxococcales bacterium]
MASNKERVDKVLVARGLAETRERAQALVMAGRVFMKGQRVDKPGTAVPLDAAIEVQGDAIPYVSRGGLKLAGVLDPLGVAVQGKVCLDVGASTGGFTDVLLQRGAARVWAIDVGHGQLHEKIRNDPRVIAHEGVNAKLPLAETVTERVALVVIDVSFISLTKILGAVVERLDPGADVVAMVKPQFELQPRDVKGGVVHDDRLRLQAVEGVVACAKALGLTELGREDSPVHGPAGNREVFVRFHWAG